MYGEAKEVAVGADTVSDNLSLPKAERDITLSTFVPQDNLPAPFFKL